MFPYFDFAPVSLGPLRIYPFGVTVACALATWLALVWRRARPSGLDPRRALRLLESILAIGFLGAMLIPRRPFAWSSLGGAFGALTGAALYLRRNALTPVERWRYLDLLAYAFPFGWAFLRLGCWLRHEHPGRLTASWLAVAYPGGSRYDLGLLEMLLSILVAALFVALCRRPRRPGFFIGWIVICGPLRILLDLLRENPPRFFGFTGDQIGGLLLTAAGVWVLVRSRGVADLEAVRFEPESQVSSSRRASPRDRSPGIRRAPGPP